MRKDTLVIRRVFTFLRTNRDLEMILDAAAETFQPVEVVRKEDPRILTTSISNGSESCKSELCKERMVEEFDISVEGELVFIY
jgi:hypothetical protein